MALSSRNTLIQKLIMQETTKITITIMEFAQLQSNEERYTYVSRFFPNLDKVFPKVERGAKKCSLTAELLKSEGNSAFLEQKYEKARELFTLSAAYAEPDHPDHGGKNTLALSIANRSGALFYAGKYTDAIVDITSALSFGYPDNLKYKLYDRKGKCYQALKAYKEAEVAFQLAASSLNEATINEQRKKVTLEQIQKKIDFCVSNKASSVEVDLKGLKGTLPKLSDEPNATHPSLSSACKVGYRPGKGRCVVAARDIKPGEVLLVEKPFAAVFIPSVFMPDEDYKDCCHHCFFHSDTLLPCLKCSGARYCSTDCRDASWETYHKYECGIPLRDLVGAGTCLHLAMRIVMVAGLDRLLEFQKTLSAEHKDEIPEMMGCNEEGKFVSSDYASIYHLESRKNFLSIDRYLTEATMSVFLVKLLEKMGFFDGIEEDLRESAMTCVGGCLIAHQVSFFATILHEEPEARVPVGMSVPSTYHLFNHSCDAETCTTWYGNNVVVHALQSFKAGQEVNSNYGHSFAEESRKTRRRSLKEDYFFDCSCEPCRKDWPVHARISQIPVFNCTHCGGRLPRATRNVIQCPHCKQTQDYKAKVQSLIDAGEQLETADDFPGLLQYIEAIDKLVIQQPWAEYVATKSHLVHMYHDKGSHAYQQSKE